MTERAKELYTLGLCELNGGKVADNQLRAFAVMLDAALPAPPRKRRSAPKVTLAFSPQDVHKQLTAECHPQYIECGVYTQSDFATLGKNLKAIKDLETADLERFIAWVKAGGFKGWNMHPTFQNVCRNLPKYLNQARAWDRRGRPSSIVGGSELGSDIDLGGAFG